MTTAGSRAAIVNGQWQRQPAGNDRVTNPALTASAIRHRPRQRSGIDHVSDPALTASAIRH
jgi:hypothetical protein